MKTNRTRIIAIAFFVLPLFLLAVFKTTPAKGVAFSGEDPAATYKAKCAACHTVNAAKFYDPAKADGEHVQALLKGKKGDKPPFMPGFEAKGMTEDEAKVLVAHMRVLRTPK